MGDGIGFANQIWTIRACTSASTTSVSSVILSLSIPKCGCSSTANQHWCLQHSVMVNHVKFGWSEKPEETCEFSSVWEILRLAILQHQRINWQAKWLSSSSSLPSQPHFTYRKWLIWLRTNGMPWLQISFIVCSSALFVTDCHIIKTSRWDSEPFNLIILPLALRFSENIRLSMRPMQLP